MLRFSNFCSRTYPIGELLTLERLERHYLDCAYASTLLPVHGHIMLVKMYPALCQMHCAYQLHTAPMNHYILIRIRIRLMSTTRTMIKLRSTVRRLLRLFSVLSARCLACFA